ncbi:MAG: PLP-dependent aminotransferase family protein, partial [Bacteroidales bacterium]|nr:PLP-dependent aminotransferase family protein [Bacteroidales bacterium]
IMELPSYLGAIQAFGRAGAIINGIPLSDDGMDLDKLDYTIKKKWKAGIRIRFIYTIPDFQNPAGITMSLQKRRQLIEIARKWEIPLLEDSPYRELSFNNNPLPSLWTLSGGEGVIQLKTFSKMLFPGMRLGWIVAEKEVLNKFILMKQSVDLCSPSFNQLILGRYISEGKMNETIHRASQLYKEKNSFMLSALAQYMPDYVSWSRPEGGMFLWLTMPGYTNSKDLVHLAVEKNVVFVPGGQFHCNKLGNNTLRLNYSYPSLSQIDKGIEGLAGAIQEHCKVKIINCKK